MLKPLVPGRSMLGRVLRAGLVATSAMAVLTFIALAVKRITHPFELDPIEGLLMDHVVRLTQGQSIYVEPSLEFVPDATMPLYPALVSVLSQMFGPALWQPRLISLLAALGMAALIFKVVERETRQQLIALGGAGTLLAGYALAGAHYDVGRPETLASFFALAGLAALRLTVGFWGAIGSGLLLALAAFTHPLMAVFAIAALLHLLAGDRLRLVPFALALGSAGVVGYGGLASWLGGWFVFYTWDLPVLGLRWSGQPVAAYAGELVSRLGPLAMSAMLALALPVHLWKGSTGIWMWAGIAGLVAGALSALDPHQSRLALGPPLMALAILGPIGLSKVVNHLAAWPGAERPGRSRVLYAILLLQFVPLAYSFAERLPEGRAGEAHGLLLQRLRAHSGPVMIPDHGLFAWQAGKGSSFHRDALERILRARGNSLLRRDPQHFDRMFATLREGPNRPMLVTEGVLEETGTESAALWRSLAPHYRRAGDLGWISDPLAAPSAGRGTKVIVYEPASGIQAMAVPDSASVFPQ